MPNRTAAAHQPDPPPQAVPRVLYDGQPLPKLFVFDLDYTLWPFWVDTHCHPPFKVMPGSDNTIVTDRIGEPFKFFDNIASILQTLSAKPGIRLAVASRTSAPDLARDLLKLFQIPAVSVPQTMRDEGGANTAADTKKEKPKRALDLFNGGLEIYPGSKVRHMETLYKKTGIHFTDMLFFDDEQRNRDTESLGVTMVLVRDGVTWAEVENGILEWRRRHSHAS